MNSLKTLCVLALVAIAFASCDDDETKVTLFSKSWKPSLTDKNPDSNFPLPPFTGNPVIYKSWLTCEQDDTFRFYKNGTLVITHKGIACDGETSSTTTLPFSLDETSGSLIIDGVTFTLHEVSSKQLKYISQISTANGFYPYIILYK